MARFEVRCCCEPLKLLGWLTTELEPSDEVRHLLLPTVKYSANAEVDAIELPLCEVRIHFRKFSASPFTDYWAIDAHEQPIELWRMLPNFKENVHVHYRP